MHPSENNLASLSIKQKSDKKSDKPILNTDQVKKGNYERMKDFVIVPQTLVNEHQKNIGNY